MSTSNPGAQDLYKCRPLSTIDGIPIFSRHDRYVQNYEKIASDHLSAIDDEVENPFMGKELWRELEDSTRLLIDQHIQPGARILDVGVGLGRLLEPPTTFECHGIDISLEYLRHAKEKGIDVALARIEDMPYREAIFDAVVCCDVLEHVFNLHECTEKILRVVRPGGIIIVRVPYKEDLSGYLDPANPYEYVHLRNFDVESLELHFTNIFECEWVKHTFAAPFFTNQTRMKLRLPPSSNRIHDYLKTISGLGHPLSPLVSICQATDEELHTWLRSIETSYPDVFAQVLDALIMPLGLNVVVRKLQ